VWIESDRLLGAGETRSKTGISWRWSMHPGRTPSYFSTWSMDSPVECGVVTTLPHRIGTHQLSPCSFFSSTDHHHQITRCQVKTQGKYWERERERDLGWFGLHVAKLTWGCSKRCVAFHCTRFRMQVSAPATRREWCSKGNHWRRLPYLQVVPIPTWCGNQPGMPRL
jgi:hypothetical protein